VADFFAIRDDGIKFQELDLELTDLLDLISDTVSLDDILEFSTRNTHMQSWWRTPSTGFLVRPANPNGEIPDICTWNDATLVFSPRAHRLLVDSLKSYGEFLPVEVEGDTYYIFNCFEIGDLNEDKIEYEYEGNIQLGLKYIEFKSTNEERLVFKTPKESCLTLFCNKRFKEMICTLGLSGLQFDPNLLIGSPFSNESQ